MDITMMIQSAQRALQSKCAEIFRNTDTGQYAFICFHCGSCFEQFNQIHDHIEMEHNSTSKDIFEDLEFEMVENDKPADETAATDKDYSLGSKMTEFIEPRNEPKLQTPQRPYKCSLCSNTYEISKSLQDHLRRKHGIYQSSSRKPYKCEHCVRTFSLKKTLIKHKRQEHPGGDSATVIVKTELASNFWSECSNLSVKEENNHTNVYLEELQDFGEKMTIKDELLHDSHVDDFGNYSSDSDQIEEFKCKICQNSYKTKNSLKEHLRKTHSVFAPRKTIIGKESVSPSAHNEPYKCNICGNQYYIKHSFTDHMRKKHSIFQTSIRLNSAAATAVVTDTPMNEIPLAEYTCDHCNKTFTSKNNILIHFRVHTAQAGDAAKDDSYLCEICKRWYNSIKALRDHQRKQHAIYQNNKTQIDQTLSKTFQCTLCNRAYAIRDSLISHLRRLHGVLQKNVLFGVSEPEFVPNELQCEVCKQIFDTKVLLNEHLHSHVGADLLNDAVTAPETKYECKPCNVTYALRKSYMDHLRKKHSIRNKQSVDVFKCDHCDQCYTILKSLHDHMRRKHGIYQTEKAAVKEPEKDNRLDMEQHFAALEKPITTPDPSYKCTICERSFNKRKAMVDHLRRRHHVYQNRSAKSKDEKWLPLDYKCDICSKLFASQRSLLKHLRLFCTNADKELFKCSQCDASFPSQGRLNIHMSRHSDLKPHRCEVCGRSYKDKGTLQQHRLSHSGRKQYQCYICGIQFYSNTHMNTHIRLVHHKGEKRFECGICGLKFYADYRRKMHEILHTGLRPYACTMCDKKFTTNKTLRNHLLTHSEKRFECRCCGKKFTQSRSRLAHEKYCHNT